MHAVVLTGHGGLDKLEYREDWPTPQPANGEVLVRVGATIVPPGAMCRLVSLIEQDLLKPLLAQSFALRDLSQAQETFMLKKHIGNIVGET